MLSALSWFRHPVPVYIFREREREFAKFERNQSIIWSSDIRKKKKSFILLNFVYRCTVNENKKIIINLKKKVLVWEYCNWPVVGLWLYREETWPHRLGRPLSRRWPTWPRRGRQFWPPWPQGPARGAGPGVVFVSPSSAHSYKFRSMVKFLNKDLNNL